MTHPSQPHRPRHVVLALLAVAGLLLGLLPPSSAVADEGRPEGRLGFGATLGPVAGRDRLETLDDIEEAVDAKLDFVRSFYRWGDTFPTASDRAASDGGRTLLVSVVSHRTKTSPVAWRDIADSVPGDALHTEIEVLADQVKAFGRPLYFTFNHEPETTHNLDKGEDEDFVAAWRKVIGVFRARGVTNAQYLWIMTDYSFTLQADDRRHAPYWYPGDAFVDHVGMDMYNWADCRHFARIPWKTPGEQLADFKAFAALHPDKGLFLPEFGSAEDREDPDRKAEWTKDLLATLSSPGHERFIGALVFHSGNQQTNADCQWWVDSSPITRDGFRDALDALHGDTEPPPPPPPPPAPTAQALLVVGDHTELGESDAQLAAHTEARGIAVEVVSGSLVTVDKAATKDVVLVSSTANLADLPNGLRDVAVPVLSSKPYWNTTMRAATEVGGAAYAPDLEVVAASHPLAGGLQGRVEPFVADGSTLPTVVSPAGGTVVARNDGAAVVVAWEAGEPMAFDVAAPSCRATLATWKSPRSVLSSTGLALLDAAVDWALDCAPAAPEPPAEQRAAGIVVADAAAPAAGERFVADLLTEQGYVASFVDDTGLVVADLTPFDVVVATNSVDVGSAAGALTGTFRPVLSAKPWLFRQLGVSSTNGTLTSHGTFRVEGEHPITAGLTGERHLFLWAAERNAPVLQRGTATGRVVTTVDGLPSVVVLERGDTGSQGPVNGCRATLPLWNTSVEAISAGARQLFVNAVRWADDC